MDPDKPPSYEAAGRDTEKAQPWLAEHKGATQSIHAIAAFANPPQIQGDSDYAQLPRRRQHSGRRITAVVLGLAAGLYYFLLSGNSLIGATHHSRESPALSGYLGKLEADEKSNTGGWSFNPFHGHHKHHKHKHLSPSQAEKVFLGVPSNDSAYAALKSYTAYSHLAGTEGDRRSAALVKKQWEEIFGLPVTGEHEHIFDAGSSESRAMLLGHRGRHGCGRRGNRRSKVRVWSDRYYVMATFPQGKSSLALKSPSGDSLFTASLEEDAVPEDPTAARGSGTDYPFHGFSFPGGASGPLVYANQGSKDDYDALVAAGVELNGTIAMVRYGSVFRGLKVSAAEEYGVKGVIIYTDPAEDGEITTANGYKAYPAGPARQPSSHQRGSVQKLSVYPGDPLTEGRPAYKNATRIPREEAGDIVGIPSLPLSGRDAKVFLESLKSQGKRLGPEWEGKLEGVEYWTGPGDATVELFNDVKENITAIWNTYAYIPGRLEDEVIIIGNHRDAWAYGAADPNSGTASVHEVLKGFSTLLSQGWTPLRSILIASWDGEEPGLIGSTEFAEDYEEWIKENVVGYLNVDVSVAGSSYELGASPSLAPLLTSVSARVSDPDSDSHTLLASILHRLASAFGEAKPQAMPEAPVNPLGSGSDYTPFLQHVGIASANIEFTRGPTDPVYHYHSIYDSFYWMENFGDPGFHRHVAIAQVLGLTALQLSDSLVLPLNVSAYASELELYLTAVKNLPLADQVDLSALETAVKGLWRSAASLQAHAAQLSAPMQGAHKSCRSRKRKALKEVARRAKEVNSKLAHFEQGFIDPEGLKGRSWYRNLVQAPGFWKGYGATPLPGLTEALTIEKSVNRAQEEADRLTTTLKRSADALALP